MPLRPPLHRLRRFGPLYLIIRPLARSARSIALASVASFATVLAARRRLCQSSYGPLTRSLVTLRLPFIIHTIFPPGRPRPQGRCGVGAGAPSPPPGVESCIIYRVGGWGKQIQVHCGIRSHIRYGAVLKSLLLSCSSTVPAQVGIRRHIGTEFYRSSTVPATGRGIRRQIGTESYQQGRVPQAYRRGILSVRKAGRCKACQSIGVSAQCLSVHRAVTVRAQVEQQYNASDQQYNTSAG